MTFATAFANLLRSAALLILPCPALAAESQPAPAPARPNIVLLVADDLGYGDLGCFGCKDIPTPHIDRLAKAGMRFTQAYAYNVCSPTRAALITGCYAERSGIRTVLMGGNVPRFAKADTLAKRLQGAGYATGLVGKWHLGYSGDVLPTRMGYDEFFGHHGGKIDYFKHTDSTQGGKHDLWEGEKEIFREGSYSTDLFADRACKFIGDHAAGPFYLQVNFNAPHYSDKKGDFQAPQAWLKQFETLGLGKGERGAYAAMVASMDAGIGRILAELDARKLGDKTVVVFVSDNGGEAAASNGILSGGKHSDKEGGIRVPLIIRWPGHARPNGECRDPAHVIDFMPSMLEAAGAPPAPGITLDGRSLLPLLEGKVAALPERALCFPPATLRRGKWKLTDGKLFDLEADPREKIDLAKQNPAVVAELAAQLAQWQASVGREPGKKRKKE